MDGNQDKARCSKLMPFVYFSGIVDFDGEDFLIEATNEDSVQDIMQKALNLEFWGELPVFYEFVDDKYENNLPEKYIIFEVVINGDTVHGDNIPLVKKTNFDVVFVSKVKDDKKFFPERIEKSLIEKRFKRVKSGIDLNKDELTKYYAASMEFAWYGGA